MADPQYASTSSLPAGAYGRGSGGSGVGVRIWWDEPKIAYITTVLPIECQAQAGEAAAQAAAAIIRAKSGTGEWGMFARGNLAADVGKYKPQASLAGAVGSMFAYAGVEDHGADAIEGNPWLTIQGSYRRMPGTGQYGAYKRSTLLAAGDKSGGTVAVVHSVPHPAKNYLPIVGPTYVETFLALYGAGFPA